MIDTHIHLTSNQYYPDAEQVIADLKSHNIDCIVNVATDVHTSKLSIEYSQKFINQSFATVGIHPEKIHSDVDIAVLQQLDQLLSQKGVVAVGEIGLDRTCIKNEQEFVWQTNWLSAQVQLAKKHNLPVILHSRQTTQQVLKIIESFNNEVKFVWHCFTEDEKVAQQVIDCGGYISFTGIITYKSAIDMFLAIKNVPDNRYMLETDGPYLTPEPLRKQGVKINMPWNIYYIAEKIAEIKNQDVQNVLDQATKNSREFFNI